MERKGARVQLEDKVCVDLSKGQKISTSRANWVEGARSARRPNYWPRERERGCAWTCEPREMLFLPRKRRRGAHTKNGQSMGSHYVVCAKSVSASRARAKVISLSPQTFIIYERPQTLAARLIKRYIKRRRKEKNCGENLISFLSLAPRIIPF